MKIDKDSWILGVFNGLVIGVTIMALLNITLG